MLKKILKRFNLKPTVQMSVYELIGSESGVKELVQSFYTIMENDPRASDCLNAHELKNGRIEESVKEKLYMFLSGWFGGPNLFIEKYGHPRMRARHLHVSIGTPEREQWLYCMQNAINRHSIKIKRKTKNQMLGSFTALAHRIQNRN